MQQERISENRDFNLGHGRDTLNVFNSDDSVYFSNDANFDSLFSSSGYQNEIKSKDHLFTTHNLSADSAQAVERPLVNSDWITIHLFICLGLIAWVQIFYRSRLKQIIKAFTGTRSLYQLYREGNIFRERISIPLFMTFLISYSLFIYILIIKFSVSDLVGLSGLKLFSEIMVIFLVSWFLKNLVISFIGTVFKNYLILTEFLLINFVFNILGGLILIPIIILAIYLDSVEWVYGAVIIWLLVFLYRIIRELFTRLTYRNFSLFYRILYLCTFEIIPLLVITKLIMSYLI
ncbi:MAG: DUF4271 domain-containing protein [Bacteroidales bacterium]